MKTQKNKSRKNFSKKIERFTKKRKISLFQKKKINGRIVSKKEGWKTVEIYGEPFEMGYAHGYLLWDDLRQIKEMFPFMVYEDFKIPFSQYLEKSNVLINPILKSKYPDLYEEIRGIVEGAKNRGLIISTDFLISWNAYMSLYSIFEKNNKERCSAFIATGNATKNGDIIMAHNTHAHFAEGRFFNIIMHLKPAKGFPFIMQISAGFIASITDWFISESGIIGSETTIANTNYKPSFGSPFFCRIREAMQYGNSLDDYVDIMLKDNAGDYACSWQFGNVNTGEIMLFELGLENYNVQRTKNGVYYGMNSAIDFRLRTLETDDNNMFDIMKSNGSRNFRLNELLTLSQNKNPHLFSGSTKCNGHSINDVICFGNSSDFIEKTPKLGVCSSKELNETYYGQISVDNAKIIISDHYDSYLGKKQMNGRSICKHQEEDTEGQVVKPIGATDGKVVNSAMAKKMEFLGRFGSSCGRSFHKDTFLKKYPEYEKWRPYLVDFPKTEWIRLGK